MGMRLKCSEQSRRVTDVEAGLGDIFGNNSAGPYDSAIADRDWEDGGICSDTYMIAKFGWPPELRFPRRASSNKGIIDEHGAVRNEAIVSDRNEFADEGVGLNPAALADRYALLYLDEWPNEAVISNRATIEIDRLHDSDILPESGVHNSSMPDLGPCRARPPQWPELM